MPPPLEHDGCRFAHDLRGSGPPVLFLQGVGVHGGGWRPQIEALAARYECLSFDNQGRGRSQPLGGTLSVERMARDARALRDAAGWDSAHLVGHSLGGLVALELALAAPRRVRSLSLLCAFARGRDATPVDVDALGRSPDAGRPPSSPAARIPRDRDAARRS